MKFYSKFLILAAIIIFSVGFTACGDSGSEGGGSAGPDPYVKFTAVGGSDGTTTMYSSGTADWIGGLSDTGLGSEPICSWKGSMKLYGIGSRTTKAYASFTKDSVDHVIVSVDGTTPGNYGSTYCNVQIRLVGQNIIGGESTAFWLTSESVLITHYDSVYVKGTFTGRDPSRNIVTGSFLFTNVGDDNWPWSGIP